MMFSITSVHILLPFLPVRSTWIRYQKSFIRCMPTMTQFIRPLCKYSKSHACRIKCFLSIYRNNTNKYNEFKNPCFFYKLSMEIGIYRFFFLFIASSNLQTNGWDISFQKRMTSSPTSIYGFWLPLWYLRFTASDCPFGILDLRLLIAPLVY